MDELTYVEMVHKARHSGNLAADSWESSALAAFAWSGRQNALGSALVDWLDGFKAGPEYLAKFLLSGELERQRIGHPRDSVDTAEYALTYYKDSRCRKCDGRGVIDQSQTQCPFCAGTGKLEMPTGNVYTAYKTIEASLQWMDSQMRFRMRGAPHPPAEKQYQVVIPQTPEFYQYMNEAGQRTPPHPAQS